MTIKNIRIWAFLLITSLMHSGHTFGADLNEPIAFVIKVKGEVIALSSTNASTNNGNDQTRVLKRRDPIFEGDKIATGGKSSLSLRFSDQGIVDLAENTVFYVQEYNFDDNNPLNNLSTFQLIEGGLRSITGSLGKASPENYTIQTSTASIGIRGTHFELVVPSVKETYASIYDGAISLSDLDGGKTIEISSAKGLGFASVISGKPPIPMAVAPVAMSGPISAAIAGLPLFTPLGLDDEEEPVEEPTLKQEKEAVSNGPLSELKQLYNAQKYKALYKTAKPMLDEWEGDPEFDFYYSVGAVETGQYDQAVFALERILMTEPNHYRAHLEIGRAYFFTQDYDKSEFHFNLVQATQPPASVSNNIQQFLDALCPQRLLTDRRCPILV